MDGRTQDILEAVVRSFVRFGEPVSSASLYRRYDFGIKPAMIRHELNELSDRGYLEQPYHSAGRVPSNKGYEFFASHVLETASSREPFRELERLFAENAWTDFAAALANDLHMFSIVSDMREETHCRGLEHLVERLEWHSRTELAEVIHECEAAAEQLKRSREMRAAEDFLEIFVGRKSPVTRSDELSVIAGDYDAEGRRMFVLAIGPKRMDYEKSARVMKGLKKSKLKNQNAK